MYPAPRYLLLLLIYFLPIAAISQTPKIDSLKKVLAALPPEGRSYASDTVRILTNWEIAEIATNYSISLKLTTESVDLANKLKDDKWRAFAYNCLGLVQFRKQFTHSAINNFFKALVFAEKAKYMEEQATSWRYLGDAYHDLGDYPKSISAFRKALKLYSQINVQSSFLMCLNNLGYTYRDAGNYKEAIKTLITCRDQAAQLRNDGIIDYAELNLASTYEKTGDLKNAILLYRKVIERSKSYQPYICSDLAKVLALDNQFAASLTMAQLAEKLINKSWPLTAVHIYENLYHIYKINNNPKVALKWYERFIALRDSTGKDAQKRQIESLKYEYENEKQRAEIVTLGLKKDESEKRTWIIGLVCVIIFIGLLYLNKRNKAINQQRIQVLQLKDQLTESNLQLTAFNDNLESTIQERTKELIQANEELIQKNLEIQNAFLNGKTQERKRVASELHDNLGSTISGLIWQLEGMMPENLTVAELTIYEGLIEQMRTAYTEIRHISHNLMPAELEKKGLVAAIEKLVADLSKNRKIKFELTIQQSIQPLSRKIEIELYSVCLELINNIVKHSKANLVLISFFQSTQSYEIKISDNGIGFAENNSNKVEGKGIMNIRQRLSDLGAAFTIGTNKNTQSGTWVFIQLPILSEVIQN